MNRETSNWSSDTLIVTDSARSRRRWLIVGAVVIVLVLVAAITALGATPTNIIP